MARKNKRNTPSWARSPLTPAERKAAELHRMETYDPASPQGPQNTQVAGAIRQQRQRAQGMLDAPLTPIENLIAHVPPGNNSILDQVNVTAGDVLSERARGNDPDTYRPGRRGRIVQAETQPPLVRRPLDLSAEGTGELNPDLMTPPSRAAPTPSPYMALDPDGYGVEPWPDMYGYTILPEHQTIASGLQPEIRQQRHRWHSFSEDDTGDFIPWSSSMSHDQMAETVRRQINAALNQPAAKALIQRIRLQASRQPKDVGPPELSDLAQMKPADAQGKVPEIHYVITDLVRRINEADGQPQTKPDAIRLAQWAEQAARVTQNERWNVQIGDKNIPASDYYASLANGIRSTINAPQMPHIPELELAPLPVTDKGARMAKRYLTELNPPPTTPAPPTPRLNLYSASMADLEAGIRTAYSQMKEGNIRPPLTEQQAIDLYTRELPWLGRQPYISNVTTPWYTIDQGKVLFQNQPSGFGEVLRKAGEWWPVQIGYSTKDITLDQSKAIEDRLRRTYGIRAVEHFAANSGIQTSLLATPGQDKFGTAAGLPWILGYDTGRARTSGALNKRLKAGLPGDFVSGQYYAEDEVDGTREDRPDPQQPHKKLLNGTINLPTGEVILWKTENTSVPAINDKGEWDEGLEANAGMGRIKQSTLKKWLASGLLSASMAKAIREPGNKIRQFQVWHIDDEGPYKGMLEAIPDSQWKDGDYDIVMSADMVKSDVKFKRGAITRGTIKFAHEQDPYVRIGFLQQLANLVPIVGQDSVNRALRHTAQSMTDKEIEAVLYEHDNPADYNADERPIAASLINILKRQGGEKANIAQKVTGSGMSGPEAAKAEMTAYAKFKAALSDRDIGTVYMPGFRAYFKHWKMAGLDREPREGYVGIQWTENPKGSEQPDIPTGFVSHESEHQTITKSTDGSDLDDELIVIPGYRRVDGKRRPAVILVRDPASPGNDIIKLISNKDAAKLNEYFGDDLYWHDIKGDPRTWRTPDGRKHRIIDMPKAITEGPLLTDVEWQPELDHGLPRKKEQMWRQSQAGGYVGALASAIYTLDEAGMFNPERHNVVSSDAIDAVAKGTGDPRRMLNTLANDILTAVHQQRPLPADGLNRIKLWLTPMYNARYGTNLTPRQLLQMVPDIKQPYRIETERRARDLARRMQTQTQTLEWMANGSPSLLTGDNETTPELRRAAQQALNELSFLHQVQIPAMHARIQKINGGELSETAEQDLKAQLDTFTSEKQKYIAEQYRHEATKLLRDTPLGRNGRSTRGRKPGDMAVALIQAQAARKTENTHQQEGFGQVSVTGLIDGLGGMEQIAYYERVIEGGIQPSTIIRMPKRAMTRENEGTEWKVVRKDGTGDIHLLSRDGKRSYPVASTRGVEDSNAAKLIGETIIYEGNLQTGGLTQGRGEPTAQVFSIPDPESVVRASAKLDWNRPEYSLGFQEDPEPADTGIRQRRIGEDELNQRARLTRKRLEEPPAVGASAERMEAELRQRLDAITANDTPDEDRDDFTDKPGDQPFGEWFRQNVVDNPQGASVVIGNPMAINQPYLTNAREERSPAWLHKLHTTIQGNPLKMSGYNTQKKKKPRGSNVASRRKQPILRG